MLVRWSPLLLLLLSTGTLNPFNSSWSRDGGAVERLIASHNSELGKRVPMLHGVFLCYTANVCIKVTFPMVCWSPQHSHK